MDPLLSPRAVALAWLVGGLVVSAGETLAPGTFLVFIGAAVVAFVLIGRDIYGSFYAQPGPLPQSRAHALLGADFFLEEPIVRGFGRIRVGDSSWRVAGADCPAGAKVRVVAVEEGSLLRVERAE